MLIVLDLPALVAYGLLNWLFGIPCCLTDAFSADYLLSSAVGWIGFAGLVVLATARFSSRRRAMAVG